MPGIRSGRLIACWLCGGAELPPVGETDDGDRETREERRERCQRYQRLRQRM